jgi:hypothetical protein
MVLFKKENGEHEVSLKTEDFISLRYANDISIVDQNLCLVVSHPWHGPNIINHTIKFIEKDWVILRGSSIHANGGYFIQEDWQTDFDFETGTYKIAHILYLSDGSEVTKQISGVIKHSKPRSIAEISTHDLLILNHINSQYYFGSRNSLFSEDELNDFIPLKYRISIGYWKHRTDERIKLIFNDDFSF